MKYVLLLICASFSLVSQASTWNAPDYWVEHVRQDLMPFWMKSAAYGKPAGNFPTFRCNNGKSYQPKSPCPELESPPEWITPYLGNVFTRMQARHTFVYGVIFHLTGDQQALAMAKSGVNYLRQNLIEDDGSVISVTSNGEAVHQPRQRTAQDLAYAQLGMAFYYYLTNDSDVLADILRVKHYIFDNYWDEESARLRWVIDPSEQSTGQEIELVAQLDQLNAYMLLMTPLLAKKEQQQWKADLARLLTTMTEQFLRPDGVRFYGTLDREDHRDDQSRHNDYGHSIKAWWMTWLTANYLGDDKLVSLSLSGAKALLAAAYSETEIGWKRLPDNSPAIWWEYAELNQAAATLGLKTSSTRQYLQHTYPLWQTRFIAEDGGSYPSVDGGLKIHPWKSDYHSLEHALIAYLTTAAFNEEEAPLYYAMPADQAASRQPYFFSGTPVTAELIDTNISRVYFDEIGIRLPD